MSQCSASMLLPGEQFADNFTVPDLWRVVVGPEKAVYHLNKGLLVTHSKYFAGLVSFPGQEAESMSVTLDDEVDSDVAFRAFIEFMHAGQYVYDTSDRGDRCIFHAKLYIMGQRLCADDFVDAAAANFKQSLREFKDQAKAIKSTASSNPSLEPLIAEMFNETTVAKFVEVVGLIYDHTPTRLPEEPLRDQVYAHMDKLRTYMVSFTTSYLEYLTASPAFTVVMRKYGDFSAEVLWNLHRKFQILQKHDNGLRRVVKNM